MQTDFQTNKHKVDNQTNHKLKNIRKSAKQQIFAFKFFDTCSDYIITKHCKALRLVKTKTNICYVNKNMQICIDEIQAKINKQKIVRTV